MKRLVHVCNKIVSVLLSVAIFFCVFAIFCGCTEDNKGDGLLRLHIRANSNSQVDQAVKLRVRDAVNDYIVAHVHRSTFEQAYEDVRARLGEIEDTASAVLAAAGFGYGAAARLSNEYFPSRKYNDTVVPEGMYDALIIELGSGKGDNWWCVIYPPLCYGEEFEYKSFFVELFGVRSPKK